MRLSLIASVSTLALLAAPVLAQTNSPSPSGGNPGGGSAASAQHTPAPDPLKQEDVSQIKGAAVYGSDSQKIGAVSTVLMRPDSKQIDRLVVNAGGILGVGGHDVALPVGQFRWDGDRDGFVIAKTGDELKQMPQWQREDMAGSGSSSARSPVPASRPAMAPPPVPSPSTDR
jgi:sporulation protein YlmC with PRC-barrel domain